MLNAEGLPRDSILSVRAGGVRRQSVAEKIDRPFRFPCKLDECGAVKLDLLRVVATGKTLCHGGESRQNHSVKLLQAAGMTGTAPVEVSLLLRAAADPAAEETQEADVRAAKKRLVQTDCQSYLEDYGVLVLMQNLLQGLMQERPVDPFAYVAERSKSYGEEQKDLLRERAKNALSLAFEKGAFEQPAGGGGDELDMAVLRVLSRDALLEASHQGIFAELAAGPQEAGGVDIELAALRIGAQDALLGAAAADTFGSVREGKVEALRLAAKSALHFATNNGGLAAALAAASRSSPEAEAAQTLPAAVDSANQIDSEALRLQARNLILQASENGQLASALAVFMPQTNPTGLPRDETLRLETKNVLLTAAASGVLAAAIADSHKGSGSGNERQEGVEELRLRARGLLVNASHTGSLSSAIAAVKQPQPTGGEAKPAQQAEEDAALAEARKELADVTRDKSNLETQVHDLQSTMSTIIAEMASLRQVVAVHMSKSP